MKKIISYSIYPILLILAFILLPSIEIKPVFAEDEAENASNSNPYYTEITITTTNLKNLVSITNDIDNIYFTDGNKIIRKNITNSEELPIFDPNILSNSFYSLNVNAESVFFAQRGSLLYSVDKTKTNTSSIRIVNKYINNSFEGSMSGDYSKKVVSDVNNVAYVIFDNYIGYVTSISENTDNDLDVNSIVILDNINNYISNNANYKYIDGGFAVSEDGSEMYYSVGSNIFKVTIPPAVEATEGEETTDTTPTLTQLSLSFSNNIKHISVDSLGNLFIWEGNTIHKINERTNETDSISFDFEIVDLSFDFCTGKAYAIINAQVEVLIEDEGDTPTYETQTQNKLVILNTKSGFVTNYTSLTETNYEVFASSQAQQSCVSLVTLNASTPMYAYQSLKTEKVLTSENKRVILLDQNANSKFYYVLDTDFASAPFYRLCYILKTAVDSEAIITPQFSTKTDCKVMVAQTKLYNYPLSVIKEKIGNEITYAPFNGKVVRDEIISRCDIDTDLPTDHNNTPFILVSYQKNGATYFGYVDSRTVIETIYDTSLKMIPVSNATLRETTTIYSDDKLSTSQDELVEGTNVTVLKKMGQIAKIQYYVGNELKTGYLNKNLVDDGSLTTLQFIGLCVAGACVLLSIVLIIIIRKRHKKHLKEY